MRPTPETLRPERTGPEHRGLSGLRWLAGLAALALPAAALADCTEMVDLDRESAAEMLAAMVSPEVSALDQLFAFEDLMCAGQPGLRELALRTASLSENPVIRGQVLIRSIFETEILTIRLDQPDEPTEAQAERLAADPIISLPVRYRDAAQGCISFVARGICDASSLATVVGTRLDISITSGSPLLVGSFAYEHGDRLTGQVTLDGATYPAWIALY